MKLSLGGLKALCQTNVVEIKFQRRVKVYNKPSSRRMLATLDRSILDSKLGREILNFKQPTKTPAYDSASKGLLTVWDLFFQNWRSIPVASCEVVSTVPTRPPEKFWEYFNKSIGNMSAAQKASFMDK